MTQLQGALIAGTDSTLKDDTLAALQALQDNHALPVQLTCDQQCWTTLGL